VHGTRWPLNLAHTCRQIRAEYMPICLRDTAIEIMGYEINKYLDIFVKPQVRGLPLKDVLGNVTLSLYIDKRDPYAYQANIHPLLKLCHACPGLNVQCRSGTSGLGKDTPAPQALLYALLNKHQNTTWKDMLENSVSHAQLVVYICVEVFIHVKDEYPEHWRFFNGHQRDWSKYDWATHIGLIPNNQEKKRLKKAEKNKVIALEVYRELHFWYGYLQC
jgi:hypothetical protein